MKGHHPFFNEENHRSYARVHIPVAPKCNLQCNFCNRKFDCVNGFWVNQHLEKSVVWHCCLKTAAPFW
jgi:MoaA/NifB/PqqE/SkfB family radical SAM enzyme